MQLEIKKHKNTDFYSVFILVISLAFYLFFALFDGAVICVDSPSYIEMNIAREPLYPMFLAFFRTLFSGCSSDFYLTVAVIIQSILAAFASWSLAAYLTKEFHLNKLFSLITLFITFAVSLLCRFAAQRGSMYSNSILTEGIAISCYLLFFRFLIEYVFRQNTKSLFICSVLTFILLSTRKQMLFSLAMLIVCILLVFFSQKQYFKGLLTVFICTVCIFFCSTVLDLGYNYILRGKVAGHSGDTRFITTMAFYTAGRDDAQYIEDTDLQNLFREIYDICEENGYLKSSAQKGWLNRVSHFGDNYDCIQIDTMWPLINEFAKERCGENVVDLNEHADEIMNIINISVIPHNIPEIISTISDNFLSGLITTVAQRNSILIWYSLFLYLFYVLLLIYHICVTKDKKTIVFALLTLTSVILNVGLVSMVIFCQTRYTIYNMALFYISLLLMLYEPFNKFLKGHTHAV